MPSSAQSLECAASTWADSARATKTFDGNDQLGVRNVAATPSAFTYLRFGLPAELRDSEITVLSATLNLYTSTSWGITPTVSVRRIDAGTPAFGRLNWNNRPGVIGVTASLSQSSAAVGHLWAIDVTTIMAAAATAEKFYGLRVDSTSTGLKHFYSSHGPREYRPTLEVTYTRKPAAPVDLSPAGNRRVSIGRPVVRAFDGWPEDSTGYLDAINVQQNSTNVWTAPTFDSGTVTTTAPELDLATTAAAVLANATSIWWRCRVRTDSGQWSLWSDGAQYHRKDKGTLAVTSPAAPSAVQQWVRNPRAVVDTADWTAGAGVTIARQTTGGYLGDTHFRLTATATGSRFFTQTATVPVVPGEVWTMSGHLKSSNWASAKFNAVYTGAANATGTTKTVTTAWARFSETVTVPALATAMQLRVDMTTGAIGDLLDLDGVMLEKAATVGPYRDGASVAWAWSGTANNSTSGPIYVTEWTPPIIWTLTGATQVFYRVVVSRIDSTTGAFLREVYDSGKIKSTETTHTLPRDVLVDDRTYRVEIYLWDAEDREATPSDPAYVLVRRAFTFAEDTTVTPVASLTIAGVVAPDLTLSWTRATAPDSYTILRKGPDADAVFGVVDVDVSPVDTITSGTSNSYRDKSVPPNRSLTYKAQAIVNGKASAANPTVVGVSQPQAIWLIHPDSDIRLAILPAPGSRTASTWEMVESTAVYSPPGADFEVQVTQGSPRGYRGTVEGILTDQAGKTLAQWQAIFWRLRERTGQLMVLNVGDDAFRCTVHSMQTAPIADVPGTRPCSFAFVHRGRLPGAT